MFSPKCELACHDSTPEDYFMSSPELCPSVESYVEVIVRAFGEEPVVLKAKGGSESSINVFGLDEKKSLSYPIAFVYEYEPQLFEQLEAAYTASDKEKLSLIWQMAKHYEQH